MKTLGEIEARYSNPEELDLGEMETDMHLLVRAVRQLGAAYKDAIAHEQATLDCGFTVWPEASPDVLALLEEE